MRLNPSSAAGSTATLAPPAPPVARRVAARAPGQPPHAPSYVVAAGVSLAVFALYLATLAPSTAMWDASEYIAATKVLGLPHPPGNPLFVLVAHAFGALPTWADYARRINTLAALSGALSAGLWFLVAERVAGAWVEARWRRAVAGVLAALVGATSFTVWNQSVVNEKVYTVSLLLLALVSWLALQWLDAPDTPRGDRLLVLTAYLVGLGYAVHPAGFLVVPALGAALLTRRPAVLRRWRLVLAAVAAFALGLTPFAYEPIRAGHFPPMNEGEPTACTRDFAWSCTVDHLTLERLVANVNRDQYGKPPVLRRQASFGAQLGMWWMYFEWQWLRDPHDEHPVAQTLLALVFFALGLTGARAHWRRDRRTFWYFAPLMATLTVALVFYLNFKLGYTQATRMGLPFDDTATEVRDRDYFFIWSFSAWGVWAALGLVVVWERLAAVLGTRLSALGTRQGVPRGERRVPSAEDRLSSAERPWLLAAPVLALALIPLLTNLPTASRAGETFTRAWAADLLNSVEPYGILVTHGDNDTFPLWYAQEVEGIRQDVVVAVTSYLNTDWYVRQLIRRPSAPYDERRGPGIYRGHPWKRPSGSPLKMTLEEADAVPAYVVLDSARRFEHGDMRATVPAGLLTRDQMLVLRFIKDSFPERPIYFSAGNYAQSLGLGAYVVREGLAQRLVEHPVPPTPGSPGSPGSPPDGGSRLDVPRTRALWDSVYTGAKAAIAQGDWIDRASVSIPYQYIAVGALLAEASVSQGDDTTARRIMKTVAQLAHATRLEGVLRGEGLQ